MARTLPTYDALPYDSRPVALTRIDTLAARAALFGADPPAVQNARVLELGCASGGNLLPMALVFPGARFVGVDLSERQVADGRARIAALGVDNLQLEHADILDWTPPAEAFDYIIAHGVYSWVPEPVRARILDLCAQKLSPQGVAFVSFNVLPGFHLRAMTRDILRDGDRSDDPPAQRLAAARALLDDLAVTLNGRDDPEAALLRREVDELQAARDSYLLHEYLADCNQPFSIRAFAEDASARGLVHLGEADLSTLSLLALGSGQEALDTQALLAAETWSDQTGLRPFRQSLLCHARARRAPDPLGVAGSLHWQAELFATADGWMDTRGRTLVPDSPWLAEALNRLVETFPASCSTAALLDDPHGPEEYQLRIGRLLGLAQAGMLRPTRSALGPPGRISPRLTPLAQAELEAGQDFVTSLSTHAPVELDAFAHALLGVLARCDSFEALVETLVAIAADHPSLAGEIGLDRVSVEQRPARIAANAERLLGILARHGVLRSGPAEG